MLVATIQLIACFLSIASASPFVQGRAASDNGTTPPEIEYKRPQYFTSLGSKRAKIRYGPFTVANASDHDGMDDFRLSNATKPCSDCTLTWIQAGLEYPNGSYANADTGFWLHHVVLYNTGPGQKDLVCGGDGQRFFASGNERGIINLGVNGTSKTGYYINNTDSIYLILELMNAAAVARDAVLTIEYEYIPGKPKGFSNVKPVWLDIGGCINSFVEPTNNAVSEYVSPNYTVPDAGEIILVANHEHDGGSHIDTYANSQVICDGKVSYGGSPGYVESSEMPGMPGMMMTTEHVSDMGFCYRKHAVQKGDTLSVKAYYNMTMHAGMALSTGELEPIMGIAIVYIK